MPDSPSGFRSWQDELALNGEQEQQLLERAMEQAKATRAQAQHRLSTGVDEARDAQLREAEGGNVATTTLSQTGSYADYQRLKQQAQGQYQVALRGGGKLSGMLRRARAQASGVSDAWIQQGDQLEAREAQSLKDSTAGAAGATRLGKEQKKREDDAAAAAKARQDETDAARAGHFRTVYEKWMAQHASEGSDNGQFRDQTERQRLAQMLSRGVDDGWKLPERTAAERARNSIDRRGWGIEADAWQVRSPQYGRATTKKGTGY